MKYISSWKLPPSLIDSAIEKFLKTGGAPPEGVKMLGRWHGMNGTGFAISESNDPKAMRRVVVTGMGIVSSIGNNTQEVLASLHEAKSGISRAEKYAELGFRSQVAGAPTIDHP